MVEISGASTDKPQPRADAASSSGGSLYCAFQKWFEGPTVLVLRDADAFAVCKATTWCPCHCVLLVQILASHFARWIESAFLLYRRIDSG
jgi:hypothetical protein